MGFLGVICVNPLDGANAGMSIESIISTFSTLIAPTLHRDLSHGITGLAARFLSFFFWFSK
jgi:hypothetical protein